MPKSTAALLLAILIGGTAVAQDSADQPETPALWTGPDDSQERVEIGAIDEDAKPGFMTTDSGLQYRILRKGDETKKANANNTVTVHYKGWLDDESIFDSSYRRGEKISFPLGRVVKGWTEGLQLVGQGGMIELIIPSELGYGSRGIGPIPPNAQLHFLVELYEIE